MLRAGFGKHDGKWFARIDLWWTGFRFSNFSASGAILLTLGIIHFAAWLAAGLYFIDWLMKEHVDFFVFGMPVIMFGWVACVFVSKYLCERSLSFILRTYLKWTSKNSSAT